VKNRNGFREQQVRMVAGMVLKLMRETKGLTQEQLSTRAGLERTSITNIEGGTQGTSLHVLLALSGALGMPASRVIAQMERLLIELPQSPVASARNDANKERAK
jgi:transcriptional regulator with XRE-family HTH domain